MDSLTILEIINIVAQITLILLFCAILIEHTYFIVYIATSKGKLFDTIWALNDNYNKCYSP
jgi:hypothetical protein